MIRSAALFRTVALLVLGLSCTSADLQSQPLEPNQFGSEYFPIRDGAHWEYFTSSVRRQADPRSRNSGAEQPESLSAKVSIRFEGYEKIRGRFYNRQIIESSFPGSEDSVYYVRLGKEGIYELVESFWYRSESLAYPLPLSVGRTWTVEGRYGKNLVRVEGVEDVKLPGQEYRNCLKLSFKDERTRGLYTRGYRYFARNIGEVKSTVETGEAITETVLKVHEFGAGNTSSVERDDDSVGVQEDFDKRLLTAALVRYVGTCLSAWKTDAGSDFESARDDYDIESFQEIGEYRQVGHKDLLTIVKYACSGPLPETDGWGHRLEFYINFDNLLGDRVVRVRSPGKDGVFSPEDREIETWEYEEWGTDLNADIIWADGYYLIRMQKPSAKQLTMMNDADLGQATTLPSTGIARSQRRNERGEESRERSRAEAHFPADVGGWQPIHVGGDVSSPIEINSPAPQYTEIARKAKIQGVVIVAVIIDSNGRAQQPRIVKGLPMGLSEAALKAVKQWAFRPATQNGEPVAVYYELTLDFRL